jgi:hypothetical protein
MKILLDFSAKSGRKGIFKLTIWNESLHQDSNDNGDRVVNFVTSKNLVNVFLHIRISDFEQGYKPRTNMIKDEKGDLIVDTHSILAWWKNHLSQLLNVHGVNDVRQIEIHTVEPLVSQPSAFEVEMAIEKLKRFRSPGSHQIPAELIKS